MENAENDGNGNKALRSSGRNASQIRTLRCEVGLLNRADGSAKWLQDGTESVVGVYGPRQTAASLEDAEKASISVTYTPKSGISGPRERLFESFIRNTIEGAVILSLNPRTLISVTVQELSSDGASLAVALNATNAALADAGIPLKYTFGAATCAKGPDRQMLVDPDALEEQDPSNLNPPILAADACGSNMTAEDFMLLKNLCYKVSEQAIMLFKQAIAAAFR